MHLALLSGSMTWDKELDFNTILEKIKALHTTKKNIEGRFYSAILLFSLANGSRIGESTDAALRWLESNDTKFEIPVEKKRRYKTTRLMVVPSSLLNEDKEPYKKFLSEDPNLKGKSREEQIKIIKQRVKIFAEKNLNINTHAIRYAFVTKLVADGERIENIAKLLGHADLRHILGYYQKKQAEKNLEEFAKKI